jgi:predicted HTH transcriptional regulator
MYFLIVIVFGFLLGLGFGFYRFKKKPSAYADYIQHMSKKKAQNKKKIITLFKEKQKITNNDVEKLLGVSDATATNYLQELEDESKIIQQGKTGKYVYYIKIK